MKNYLLTIIFAASGLLMLNGQDIHFSQFYNTPLQINPAYQGHFPGSYRVQALYRNQWNQITTSGVYSTTHIAADMNFKPEGKLNSFGIGVAYSADASANGALQISNALIGLSYHLSLNKKETNYVSFGLQGEFLGRQLKTSELDFAFNPDGSPNGAIPSFITSENSTAFDLRLGVAHAMYWDKGNSSFVYGLAVHHLLDADLNLIDAPDSLDASEMMVSANATAQLRTSKELVILPSLLILSKAGVTEINIGTTAEYDLNPNIKAIGGIHYRFGDSAIAALGAEYKKVRLMMSYDFNTSSLSPTTSGLGGYELSIGYIGTLPTKAKPILPAIRFSGN